MRVAAGTFEHCGVSRFMPACAQSVDSGRDEHMRLVGAEGAHEDRLDDRR